MAFVGMPTRAVASEAYGSTNNFDCVNDTGSEGHGFDIELDDIRSTDITYTYDYNHYGVPKITEDLTDPVHPKVLIRYAATRNPDGTWSAYTAIPAGPIAPTAGHQFTDPSVNFGGEHFGAGFTVAPSAVHYYWLNDDGAGNLVRGQPVYVATPTFVYYPPAGANPPQVVAKIVPPNPPAPVYQFGIASWVKAIKTTTHNAGKVHLEDLVSDDPGKPQPWANGEPAEVETEWSVLQTEFAAAGGGVNGELAGAPEDLPGGDEVVTRRYEFYKYIGPVDAETAEAMATAVAADGIHGVGSVTYADYWDPNTGDWHLTTVDLSTVKVVGDFFGAQMSGFDKAPDLGLINHIQDGDVGVAYPNRTVVVPGGSPWLASIKSGSLPDGLTLDLVTGVLSGTPTTGGTFMCVIEASDLSGALVTKTYTVNIRGGLGLSNWNMPATLNAGKNTVVTVNLDGAVATDQFVTFTSSDPNLIVTQQATVPAGSDHTTINIRARVPSVDTSATVNASYAGTTLSDVVTIKKPTFTVGYNVNLVVGGGTTPVTGKVQFSTRAPTGGFVVNLSSGASGAMAVPATVTVPAGATTANFSVTHYVVGQTTGAQIDASWQGSTLSKTLKVLPPAPTSVRMDKRTIVGGSATVSTGTVTVATAAPVGGTTVWLSSSNTAAVTVPTLVVVPEGATTTTFTLATSVVATNQTATITAWTGLVATPWKSVSQTVTVIPPRCYHIEFSVTPVTGGNTTVCLLGLDAPAPTGGSVISVVSSDPTAVPVPATVTIPAGAKTVTFNIVTGAVGSTKNVTITTVLGLTKYKTLIVTP